MRPSLAGLFIAFFAAACLTGAVANAAPDAGVMKAAAGIVSQAGSDCQVADARLIGEGEDPKTHAKTSYYEVACTGAEGFVAEVKADKSVAATYSCLQIAAQQSNIKCTLSENANPKTGVAAAVSKIAPDCQLADAKIVGMTNDTNQSVFEVSCKDGGDFVLTTSVPSNASKHDTMAPCIAGGVPCTLSDAAGQQAYIDKVAAQSGTSCVVKDRRFVGVSNQNQYLYEVACQDGKGYVLIQSGDLKQVKASNCANENLCELSSNKEAQNQQSDLYTKLAQKAGFNCTVSKYGVFNVNVPGHEVVELACSNRTDGAVAVFPANPSDPSQIYDCAHSELAGYRCSFSDPNASMASLTADLKKLGKTTCVVSSSRFVGVTTDKTGYVEVGCADGNPGFMIEYATTPVAPKAADGCAFAKDILGGCKLPNNSKKG
jgi:hypothetical protein